MKWSKIFVFIALVLIFFSCSKEGDPGPAGNANVTVFNFGPQTFNGTVNYLLAGTTEGMMDSCLVLAYYNPSLEAATSWYPVPGLGPSGAYETRAYWWQANSPSTDYTFSTRLVNADGSGAYSAATTFRKFRVFLVPANNIMVGRGITPSESPVDYNDYDAVCRYYHITP